MNHPREELEECVYDYLASKPNEYHISHIIFHDILTNSNMHHCNELTNSMSDKIYFTWACNNVRFLYEGIVHHRDMDGTIYLAFVTDDNDSDKIENNDEWIGDYNPLGTSLEDEINYFFKNKLYERYLAKHFTAVNYDDPLIFEICRYHDNADDIIMIIREKGIDISMKNSKRQTLLDVAIESRNIDLIIKLVRLSDALAVKSVLMRNDVTPSSLGMYQRNIISSRSSKTKGCCKSFFESIRRGVSIMAHVGLTYHILRCGYWAYTRIY